MLLRLWAEHERVAPVGEQLVDKRVRASWGSCMVLEFADWIGVRVFRLSDVVLMGLTSGMGKISTLTALPSVSRCLVWRAVPGAAQQETEERGANAQQGGVVPK